MLSQVMIAKLEGERTSTVVTKLKIAVHQVREQVKKRVIVPSETLAQKEEEITRLDEESQALHEQNQQLMQTLQSAQQDLRISQSEVTRLQEREAAFENEYERVLERSAILGGHANQKQKIKHLAAIKDENEQLRQELRRVKQQLSQMGRQLRGSQFFDVIKGSGKVGAAASDSGMPYTPRTPGNVTPARRGGTRTPASSTPGRAHTPGRKEDIEMDATEHRGDAVRKEVLMRQLRVQKRASERATMEYHHLAGMVEQVLAVHGPQVTSQVSSKVAESESAEPCQSLGPQIGSAALVQRLREVAGGVDLHDANGTASVESGCSKQDGTLL